MNALEDADITRALYRASQAGVQRRPDRARHLPAAPGLPGLSDNVRVVSIVGRFLEHGRIYYFRNGGDEEYFIGSADCMKRNLESRVEVVAPVEDPELRKELRQILDVQASPQHTSWEMQADGTYVLYTPADGRRARSRRSSSSPKSDRRKPGDCANAGRKASPDTPRATNPARPFCGCGFPLAGGVLY